MPFVKVQTKTT